MRRVLAAILVGAAVSMALVAGAQDTDADRLSRAEARRGLARDLRNGRIIRGKTTHRMIHFTFDDGPRLETTPMLLDHLDDAGVKGTFFVVARQIEGDRGRRAEKAALVRDIIRRGHTVGLHGFDHTNLLDLTEEETVAQLERSEEVFEDAFGERPWLFRPPYGHHDEISDRIVADRGYTQVLWSIIAEGRHVDTADGIVRRFERSLEERESSRRPGGFVILHDTQEHVVEAFPRLVEVIHRRNCALLADPGAELWDVVDDPRPFHAPRGDAEPSEYAPLLRLSETALQSRQRELRVQARARCLVTGSGSPGR